MRLLEEKAFTLDVGQLCEPRRAHGRALIILNYPHNPTGGAIPESGLRAIADAAAKHDVPVLSDEIYGRILYDGEHTLDRVHARDGAAGHRPRRLLEDATP